MKKVIVAFFVISCSVVAYKIIDQYLFGWHYVFAPSVPFHGDTIINPYNAIHPSNVQVANFHAHAQNGILNGEGKPNDIFKKYDEIGVNIHAVSPYHRIDTNGKHLSNYLPVYEHGYNLTKTHQLIIGAKAVVQKDYIFPQTIHNKQEILERLAKDTNAIVVLNHPALGNGYSVQDLKLLHYYDHIEVLSPYANSISYWDTLLTAGKKIFIVGNDDLHDIFDNNEIGRFTNLLYTQNSDQNNIKQSLKSGSHAVVWLPQKTGESLIEKREKINGIKYILQKIQITSNQLSVTFNRPVDTLLFIGNEGKVYKSVYATPSALFTLPDEFTYIRIEAVFSDGTKLLFNPIFRSSTSQQITRNQFASLFVLKDENTAARNKIAIFSLCLIISFIPFRKQRKKLYLFWGKNTSRKNLSHD